jgi:hypothetical protein
MKLHSASTSLKTLHPSTQDVSSFQDVKILKPEPFKWSFLRFSRIHINSKFSMLKLCYVGVKNGTLSNEDKHCGIQYADSGVGK